ncbi:MAG: hypothetical protein HQK88_11935 [Nitrospirae bacterium]|nr:hypothetical protein [Nitrospirota bacterium]MBF0535686.1 hypothetical protein [Nitrospirota bacterium]MBF0617511.1 hypothetical protein [Nitrospirota bacterium]
MAKTIELYTMLKDKLGDAEAKFLVETMEDVAKESKVDYKDDLKAIRTDMVTKSEMKLYIVILALLIILSNPRALDLISKLLGIAK